MSILRHYNIIISYNSTQAHLLAIGSHITQDTLIGTNKEAHKIQAIKLTRKRDILTVNSDLSTQLTIYYIQIKSIASITLDSTIHTHEAKTNLRPC